MEAAKTAELIIVGTVTETTFSGGTIPSNLVRVSVNEILKGKAPSSVEVYQKGGPGSYQGREFLGEAPGDPLLLQDDRVLLFLISDDDAKIPGYRVVYGMGSYFFEGENVRVAPANPQADQLSKLSPREILAQVRELSAVTP